MGLDQVADPVVKGAMCFMRVGEFAEDGAVCSRVRRNSLITSFWELIRLLVHRARLNTA